MENDAAPGIQGKEKRANLIVPLALLIFLFFAWFVYVYQNRIWIIAFQQCISWLANPATQYTPIQVKGILMAILATIEILILGVLSANTLLASEKDKLIKFVSALGLGAGFTALITVMLAIFGSLYQLPLNTTIILLCVGFLLAKVYKQKGKEKISIKNCLKDYFSIGKINRPDNFKLWLLACSAIGIIFFFCFYQLFIMR